jgi:phage terminase large subunit
MKLNKAFSNFMHDNNKIILSYGGRGSGKTVAAAQKIINDTMTNTNNDVLVLRKYAVNIKQSVYEEIKKCINYTRYAKNYYNTGLPALHHIIHSINCNNIEFAGLDELDYKYHQWIFKTIWIEDAQQLTQNDFIKLLVRFPNSQFILTFNPTPNCKWIKETLIDTDMSNVSVYHTTYKDNPFMPEGITNNFSHIQKETYNADVFGDWD